MRGGQKWSKYRNHNAWEGGNGIIESGLKYKKWVMRECHRGKGKETKTQVLGVSLNFKVYF